MFTKRMSKLTTRAKEELERLREGERATSEHLIEVLFPIFLHSQKFVPLPLDKRCTYVYTAYRCLNKIKTSSILR